jgi:chromosome segregation ATPase
VQDHPTDHAASHPPEIDPLDGVSRLGDKVMEMLASVERQFDSMKTAEGETPDHGSSASSREREQFQHDKQQWQRRLDEAEARVGELLGQVEAVSRTMRSKHDALDEAVDHRDRLKAENDTLQRQIEEARRGRDQGRDRAAQLEAAVRDRDAQLAESAEKLTAAGEKLVRFSSLLQEQQAGLEEGAAARATVEQQKQQIEELTHKLAEANLSGSAEAVAKRDQRISELTEALRQSRGQTGAAIDVGALESRNASLEEENKRLQVELTQARVAHEQAQQQLDTAISESAVRAHADEHAAQMFDIEREQLRGEADQAKQRCGDLEEQVRRLEAQRDRASSGGDVAVAGPGGPTADIAHLHRRRRRLQRMRGLMARRPVAPAPAVIDDEQRVREIAELREQRVQLRETARTLTRTEKKMRRRWAAQRTVTTLCGLALLVMINAAASWYAPPLLGFGSGTAADGALLSPAAAAEAHLAMSLPIFLGSTLLSVLLGSIIFGRLVRARRLFDEEIEALGSDLD